MGVLLTGPLDLRKLALLAHREQAYTVLWNRLLPYRDALPPEQAASFARLAVVAEFHLMHLETRLAQSVAALAGAGIDVLLLKGAGLAYTVYTSFLERPMSDIDLLVRTADVPRAQAALRGIGWSWNEGAEAADFYASHHHLPPMFDPRAGGANLELHTALFIAGHPFRLSTESIWAAAREVRVRNACAFVPHPHHQLLHACLHFAWGHMMHSGAWRTFRDVEALTSAGRIDWDAFVELAVESRGASCCYWTFDLARALGGVTSVPDEVLTRLRPPIARVVHGPLRRYLGLTVVSALAASPSVRLDRFVWEAAILPEHYEHGAIRPWVQEDRLVTGAQAAVGGRRNRVVAGRQKLEAYSRYLRAMLAR